MKKRKWRFLRVNSVTRLPFEKKMKEEMHPLSHHDVDRMKELDLQVKLCDMGNACYIEKHYSDII